MVQTVETDLELTLRDLRGEREPVVRRLPGIRPGTPAWNESVYRRRIRELRLRMELATAALEWRFDDDYEGDVEGALTLAEDILAAKSGSLYGGDMTYVATRVPAEAPAPVS